MGSAYVSLFVKYIPQIIYRIILLRFETFRGDFIILYLILQSLPAVGHS